MRKQLREYVEEDKKGQFIFKMNRKQSKAKQRKHAEAVTNS